MTKVTDENDNLVDVEEAVVFEPMILGDDEVLITQHAEAEKVIKDTLNFIDSNEGREAKYPVVDKTSDGVKAIKRTMETLLDARYGALEEKEEEKETSDGTYASYYDLPEGLTAESSIQDLIAFKNMNAQLGEIFRAVYRYGEVQHSDKMRDANKILFYIQAEIARIEKYGN